MSWIKNLLKSEKRHAPVSLDDENFGREVRRFSGACLVDVWGPDCQPCQKLAPLMEKLATRYQGRVKVCEMNAAASPGSAARMGVRGTPTVVAYKNGAEIGRVVGWKPLAFWEQLIEAEFGEYVRGEVVPEEAGAAEPGSARASSPPAVRGRNGQKADRRRRRQGSRPKGRRQAV